MQENLYKNNPRVNEKFFLIASKLERYNWNLKNWLPLI